MLESFQTKKITLVILLYDGRETRLQKKLKIQEINIEGKMINSFTQLSVTAEIE